MYLLLLKTIFAGQKIEILCLSEIFAIISTCHALNGYVIVFFVKINTLSVKKYIFLFDQFLKISLQKFQVGSLTFMV